MIRAPNYFLLFAFFAWCCFPAHATNPSLTGTWSGKYVYDKAPRGIEPEQAFQATLTQKGTSFTGEVTESVHNPYLNSTIPLHASIKDGSVSPDGKITFNKIYDGPSNGAQPVAYTGAFVAAKGVTTISGTWMIGASVLTGHFDMTFSASPAASGSK